MSTIRGFDCSLLVQKPISSCRICALNDKVVWKVRLWAAKLKNPNDNAEIGEVLISVADGTVFKSDLRPERVD